MNANAHFTSGQTTACRPRKPVPRFFRLRSTFITPGTTIEAVRRWSLLIARTVMFTMFGMVPIHYFVNCQASGTTAGFALVLLFVTGVLSLMGLRFSPFGWALVAMVLHSLSAH